MRDLFTLLSVLSAGCARVQGQEHETWAITSIDTDTVTALPGTVTYRLMIELTGLASNVYAIAGTKEAPMTLPPAYQEPAPVGVDIGGISPAEFARSETAMADSWLTIGITNGYDAREIHLESMGIPFEQWTADTGLTVDDGGVFFVDPRSGPRGPQICLGQITLPQNTEFTASFTAQGQSSSGPRWRQQLHFRGGTRPPPPPAPRPPPPAPRPSDGEMGIEAYVTPSIEVYAVNGNGVLNGYTTYRLQLTLTSEAHNLYTIFGNPPSPSTGMPGTTMTIPAAYQSEGALGKNLGGTNPRLWQFEPSTEFDSWLTVGLTEGDRHKELVPLGIAFDNWTDEDPLVTSNGAVFYMNPDNGAQGDNGAHGGPITVAQLTVPTDVAFHASMGVRGRLARRTERNPDWDGVAVFDHAGGPARPRPGAGAGH